MKFPQRLDHQVIDREPDRPAPVGVAAVDGRGRFARLVGHAIAVVDEGLVEQPRDIDRRPKSERNCARVEDTGQDGLELVAVGQRQQSRAAAAGFDHQAEVAGQHRAVAEVPLHPPAKVGQLLDVPGSIASEAKRGIKPTNERTLRCCGGPPLTRTTS